MVEMLRRVEEESEEWTGQEEGEEEGLEERLAGVNLGKHVTVNCMCAYSKHTAVNHAL